MIVGHVSWEVEGLIHALHYKFLSGKAHEVW